MIGLLIVLLVACGPQAGPDGVAVAVLACWLAGLFQQNRGHRG